jgi:HSP20 family protein
MNLPALRNEFDLFNLFSDDFDRFFGSNSYRLESGDVIYELEVPGFNKDNLEIELSDGVLTIKGKRKLKEPGKANESHLYKQLTVGAEVVDADAEIKDGILYVTLKYPETQPGKQIEVK